MFLFISEKFFVVSMDNEDSANISEQVAGPSTLRKSRRSSSSSSNSSSDSDSSSSTSSSAEKCNRNQRKKKRGGKHKHRKSNRKYRQLSKELRELRKCLLRGAMEVKGNGGQVSTNNYNFVEDDSISVSSNISRNLYDSSDQVSNVEILNDNQITLNMVTKLKEPSMPKSSEAHLKLLCDLQHLDSSTWDEIRYSETQKLYNHYPGFSYLELNEEVGMFQSPRHLIHADKAFAALSLCIIKQRDALNSLLKEFTQWAKDINPDFNSLNLKLSELISNGEYQKVSTDMLQIVCGHRAEILQMRRDSVIKQAKDPLLKATLRKIPPTCTNLFNADKFSLAVEKAGGVRKCFWPLKKTQTPTSQAGINKPSVSSQEHVTCNKPSQGMFMNLQSCCQSNRPSQGGLNSRYHGHNTNHSAAPNERDSFRAQGNSRSNPKYRNQSKPGQKRAYHQAHNATESKRRKF